MSLKARIARLERLQANRPATAGGFGGSPGFWRAIAGADGGATPEERAEFDKMIADLGPYEDRLAARIAAVRNSPEPTTGGG